MKIWWMCLMVLLVSIGNGVAADAPVPKTGQATCYDAVGNVIPCADTGQDGELQRGVAWPSPRFIDNGDGTVTDTLTGLMWLVNANCLGNQEVGVDLDGTVNDGQVTWQHALDFVAALNDGTYDCDGAASGHSDWRLPNIRELDSLCDISQLYPAVPSGHPFSGLVSGYYWSGTSSVSNPDFAWIVLFGYGNDYWFDKDGTFYVWPVRAGQ